MQTICLLFIPSSSNKVSILATNKIFLASSLTAANKITGIFLEFALAVFLAKVLGAEQYGLYSYAVLIITAAANLSTLGLDSAALRFIPEYNIKKKRNLMHGYVIFSFKRIIITSSILLFIINIISFFLTDYNHIFPLLSISTPLIPILSLSRFRQYLLRSFKHVVLSEVLELIAKPILFLIIIFSLIKIFKFNFNADQIIVINIIISLIIFTTGISILIKYIPDIKQIYPKEYDKKKWTQVSIPLFFMTLVQLLSGHSDTLLLGAFTNFTESGIYSIAVRISFFIGFSLLAMNMILAPIISELFFSEKHSELQVTITYVTKISLTISIFIFIFIIIFGKNILLQFGNEFNKAYIPLIIISLGQVVNVACGSSGLILSITGHHKYTAIILGLSALLNIILNFILIPYYGMAGAAISNSIAIIFWNVLMSINVFKKLNINPTAFKI